MFNNLLDCGQSCVSCNLGTGCEKSIAKDLSLDYWIEYDTSPTAGESSFSTFVQIAQCDTKINCKKCLAADLT